MDTLNIDYHPESGQERTQQMFRTIRPDGVSFIDFLGKFSDAENFEELKNNPEELDKRFWVFKRLPEVVKTMQNLAQEKNGDLLGRKFSDEELKIIADELEKRVCQEHDFDVLETLSKQVTDYHRLPKEITQLKNRLADLGNKEVLGRKAADLEQGVHKKTREVEQAESSAEGMHFIKRGIKLAGELGKKTELAEKVFMREAEVVVDHFHAAIGQLERQQQAAIKTDQQSPQPGRIVIPDIAVIKHGLLEADKQKKDPGSYLEILAASGFGSSLEKFQKDLRAACDGAVGELKKLQKKPKEAAKHRHLQESLDAFNKIRTEVSGIVIDPRWDQELIASDSDLRGASGIRQGLLYLQGDPTNGYMVRSIQEAAADFQSGTGKNLATALRFGAEEFNQIQQHVGRSEMSDAEARSVLVYSQKGFWAKFSRDPLKDKEAEVRRAASGKAVYEEERDRVIERIAGIENAESLLKEREERFESVKGNLFLTLRSFESIFAKSRKDAGDSISAVLNGEDLGKIVEAKGALDRLAKAVAEEPGLYGADDLGGGIDIEGYGKRTLKDLQESYLSMLQAKVEKKVMEILKSMNNNKLTPDSIASQLKKFEDGLGSVATTEQYRAVRLQAFRNLTAKNTILNAGKKIALSIMLGEARSRGFMPRGLLDLDGFVASAAPAAA